MTLLADSNLPKQRKTRSSFLKPMKNTSKNCHECLLQDTFTEVYTARWSKNVLDPIFLVFSFFVFFVFHYRVSGTEISY